MKTLLFASALAAAGLALPASAVVTGDFNVEFDGSGDTTGDRFSGSSIPGTFTQDVAEEKGVGEELENIDLELTISSTTSGSLNQNNGGFGINTATDVSTTGLEPGDDISFSFNLPVEILRFDFQDFDGAENDGEAVDSINFTVGSTTTTITFGDLDSTSVDDFTLSSPLFLAANETIVFDGVVNGTAESDGIAFDEFEIRVVPEPASLALLAVGGMLASGRYRQNRC